MSGNIPFAFKKIYPDSQIPKRMHEDDAGFDLFLYSPEILYPRTIYQLHTGILIQLPPDTVGFICPRSGLALKKGLDIINSPGTIDSSYRGEIIVLARTVSEKPAELCRGTRIAQLVPCKLLKDEPEIIYDELVETDRGDSGFGSTDQ